MSQFAVEVEWLRGAQDFLDHRYSRRHVLRFDGGIEVAGSSSPAVVPPPPVRRGGGGPGRSVRRRAIQLPHAVVSGPGRPARLPG